MSGRGFIAPEAPTKCEDCGRIEETRPYGPGGMRICFECGEKNPEERDARAAHMLFGDPLPEKYQPKRQKRN